MLFEALWFDSAESFGCRGCWWEDKYKQCRLNGETCSSRETFSKTIHNKFL